jgi:hypothetical protein
MRYVLPVLLAHTLVTTSVLADLGDPPADEALIGMKIITTATLTVAHTQDARVFAAHSDAVGGWDIHALPEGVRGQAIVASGVAALETQGGEVRQVVAFSPGRGRWVPCPLTQPTTAKCTPVVSSDLVAFHVGGVVYAFSPKTATWDRVDGTRPPSVSAQRVVVRDTNRVSIFGVGSGRFDTLHLEQLAP